ncbi:hypothetical protein AAON49_10585 [Pseudotenacibaculum sp. MALMAid0570]|uniref:hypothetical protein n=1 Tax=Pseudotenacibaculum sp. MALMAid0570 TaxID=3143938 RepID=UPI0032DFBB64
MRNTALNFTKYFLVTIPFIIGVSLIFLLKSSFFLDNPEALSSAITIDFLITIPFIYFLIIRKRNIPKFTVITVAVLGVVVLSIFLPQEHSSLLNSIKTYLIPVLELGVLSFLIYKVRQVSKRYQKTSNDFYTNLKQAASEVFPKKIATILVTEISMIYYGFLRWKSPKLTENEFSYHKKNALVSILAGFTLLIVIETVWLHAFLVKWNLVIGWIITVLSAYTGLQIFALTKSVMMRPYIIDKVEENLNLRYGFFVDTFIPINKIESLEVSSKDLPEDKSVIPFSPLGTLGEYNIILHMKEEIRFSGIYGLKRKARSIAIYVDDKERFKNQLEEILKN